MASVWLARDRRHDRLVAIKVLHPSLAGAIGVDRFLRAIRVTARRPHPAIVQVLDPGAIERPDGPTLPWYAMAYVAGESLRARLDRSDICRWPRRSGSPRARLRRLRRRIGRGSSTATSSPRTCSSPATGCTWPTSA